VLKLTGRYYRTIPLDRAGYETEVIELDPAKTALVGMHCWNIGAAEGPPIDNNYFVGMGSRESFREADRMVRECIRPAMDAARKAGILVCHVEHDSIAAKHPEAQIDQDPPPAPEKLPPIIPGWRKKMEDRFHGIDCRNQPPLATMDRMKIVSPLPGELFVYQTEQFDRALRAKGIENLIYTGFATDMCVLRAPGGVEPMAVKEYRIFLVRDATIGVELPDMFEDRVATRWAIRYFETHFGDTIELADFLKACQHC